MKWPFAFNQRSKWSKHFDPRRTLFANQNIARVGPIEHPRISTNPDVLDGLPCIRETSLPVHRLLALLGEGKTHSEIAQIYPFLDDEDIRAAIAYAADVLQHAAE